MLHRRVSRHLDQRLNSLLKVFRKRHRKHQRLSVDENKRVNRSLKSMSAMLMKRFARLEKKHAKKQAKSEKTTSPAPKAQQPPVNTQVPETPVRTFVKRNLRKKSRKMMKKEKHTLADLLKFGVHLRTGGVLHFAVPSKKAKRSRTA